MIESISAITLATHDMPRAVRFYSVLGFSSCMAAKSHHSPAFAQELAISTSSVSLPSGTGPGGDGSSSTLPMSTRFTSVHALRDTASQRAARRRMGRALLPSGRPQRPRAQFCPAIAAHMNAITIKSRASPKADAAMAVLLPGGPTPNRLRREAHFVQCNVIVCI